MEKIIISKLNEVFLKIDSSRATTKELKEFFVCKAPNFMFHPMYKSGVWNGNLYYFNTVDHTLPIGLLPKLIKFCQQYGYEYEFNFSRKDFGDTVTEEFMDKFYEYIFPPETNIFPRDYQQEATLAGLNSGRCVLELCTSSGKSVIIYSLIRYMLAKGIDVLLVVPTVSLVEQMYSDFQDYGWKDLDKYVDKLYSGQKTSDKKVLISTWQSIHKRDISFFSRFGALLCDETHTLTGLSLQDIAKKCINAKYRIGLTGTMPKEEANRMTIEGYLGPVSYVLKAKELMDRDIISQLQIKNLLMKYPNDLRIARPSYQQEVHDILEYQERNKALEYIIDRSADGHNSLILLHRIEHLRIVKEYLEKNFPNHIIYDIFGDTLPQRREEIRKRIENEGNVILVSTFATMSTGVNIKKLHNIIFFASYKSMIKILQSIGRGLRKHDTKEFVTVWDCVDDLRYRQGGKSIKNYCFKHWEQRKEYYLEQEFTFSDTSIEI